MGSPTVEELIRLHDLKPHPEGGYYKETYRAPALCERSALPPGFKGDRNFSTAILFLLPGGATSKLHRIPADEMWHFYLGDPLTVVQISPRGRVELIRLGHDLGSGLALQHVVPAGYWFGAYCNPGGAYSLVGCTVSPGFDFADFELGKKENLLREFPAARAIIEHLGH